MASSSFTTLAALVATSAIHLLAAHVFSAFEDGVSRREVEQTLAQLAFFKRWRDALAALSELVRVIDEETYSIKLHLLKPLTELSAARHDRSTTISS